MQLREVAFPERIIDRHVGGNTTYARSLEHGLVARGVRTSRIPAGRTAVTTAATETREGLKRPASGRVLHYSADTGPLVRTRQPSVVTVHGVASRWVSTVRTNTQEWIWRGRVRRAIASTGAVVTVSGSSAADIAEVFDVDPARITTIPHGIDRERFERPTALSPRLRHLALTPYALYLGNIEPRKNLVELAHAFAMPSVRGLGMKLVVAGRPAWNADASMEAIASTDVDYLGFVSDDERVSLMQHAALFVFPSLYEGFGFPVLEAMAAGTPVLTSSRGSLAEVAGPALTIEDLSRDGIAAAVAGSLADLPRLNQSASDGREWVKRFNWSDSVERHLTVYQRLLETAPE